MSIINAIASVAVHDLSSVITAAKRLLEAPRSRDRLRSDKPQGSSDKR